MKAALKTADGRFTIEDVEEPTLPGADWVKARVRVAGICGTDLRHWEKPDEHLHCTIMGHELAGQVVEVGPEVKRVAVGDRVLIESVLGCGQCDWCRVRQYNRCPALYPKLDNIANAHSDLQNLVNATEIGTLFLDAELRIKMLTPSVERLFSVTDSDVGRPITDFTHKLVYDGVEGDARTVLRTLAPMESEVETKDGRWFMMRLRPYRTVEDRIEGIVLSFVDITQRREAEDALRASEERYRAMVDGQSSEAD